MTDRMILIEQNIIRIRERMARAAQAVGRNPNDVRLIAVSKNFPVSDLEFATVIAFLIAPTVSAIRV